MELIDFMRTGIGVIGVAVIVWGVFVTFFKMLRLEHNRWRGGSLYEERDITRKHRFLCVGGAGIYGGG